MKKILSYYYLKSIFDKGYKLIHIFKCHKLFITLQISLIVQRQNSMKSKTFFLSIHSFFWNPETNENWQVVGKITTMYNKYLLKEVSVANSIVITISYRYVMMISVAFINYYYECISKFSITIKILILNWFCYFFGLISLLAP